MPTTGMTISMSEQPFLVIGDAIVVGNCLHLASRSKAKLKETFYAEGMYVYIHSVHAQTLYCESLQ